MIHTDEAGEKRENDDANDSRPYWFRPLNFLTVWLSVPANEKQLIFANNKKKLQLLSVKDVKKKKWTDALKWIKTSNVLFFRRFDETKWKLIQLQTSKCDLH